MNPVRYAELTPAAFRERLAQAPVAYLPLGTLEWHGEHLPLGADGLQSAGFFEELAQEAGGIVLPMLFVGPDRMVTVGDKDYHGMDMVGYPQHPPRQLEGSAYWVDEKLFTDLLESVLAQLARAGFRVVVAHGHGPSTNTFLNHMDRWSGQFGLSLFACWGSEEDMEGLGLQTDHAGGNETSLMMALRPDLVRLDLLDPDPAVMPLAVAGEDPRTHASPARGHAIIATQKTRMAGIIREALGSDRPRTTTGPSGS